MTNKELEKYLDDLLNVEAFKDYCPNGLQIEGQKNVKKIAYSVSATVECLEKCIENKVDTLICHHGILWNHDGGKSIKGNYKKRMELIIKNDINLFAYHLPLDSHLELGNAAQIAQKIGLKKISPFGSYKGSYVGVSGELGNKLDVSALKKLVSKICNFKEIKLSQCQNRKLKKISIVTGSGASYLEEALNRDMDVLITGEMSEYHWHNANENDFLLIATGHHATERFGVQALCKHLNNKFNHISLFIDSENPI